MTDELRIEYLPLSELQRHPRNPKQHDLGALHTSVNRFGYVTPVLIDERTGYLVAGHGRLDALAQLKAQGKQPPARIVARNGDWLVPVVRGVEFASDAAVEAYLVADNRLTELGGWDEPELVALLQDLAAEDEELLRATGYDGDDLEALLRMLTVPGLDQLEDEYGDHDDDTFGPVIRLQVDQDTFAMYESLMADAPGANEAEKFAAIIGAVDVSVLNSEL